MEGGPDRSGKEGRGGLPRHHSGLERDAYHRCETTLCLFLSPNPSLKGILPLQKIVLRKTPNSVGYLKFRPRLCPRCPGGRGRRSTLTNLGRPVDGSVRVFGLRRREGDLPCSTLNLECSGRGGGQLGVVRRVNASMPASRMWSRLPPFHRE